MAEENHSSHNAVIHLKGVSIADLKEPARVVLEKVDWTAYAGDFWAIGGLHASGKSNLLAMLGCIMPPAAGEYTLFDEKFSSRARLEYSPARRRLGIVFDGGRLVHDLTVAENIALPLRYHRNQRLEDTAEEVEALLEAVGLTPFAGSHPASMGRNWQQRAGLARALALKPEILLLDNCLTGLDPRDAGWWLAFLSSLASGHPLLDNRPMTLIATADDLRPWRERASQFAILKNRQFVVVGSQSDLSRYSDPMLHELLPAIPAHH